MLTVGDVKAFIDERAPFATQADFDNSGLLIGSPDTPVRGIHVALDVTERVLDEAESAGANVLVTHHPLMFHPRSRLTEDDGEARLICRLIRGRMALISAHTCLDQAPGGINDVLAGLCGLKGVTGEGYLRVGDLSEPVCGGALARRLEQTLHTVIRVMGDDSLNVRRLGVSSGAGSDGWQEARAMGADAFLSGEIRHHHALAAAQAGMLCLEAGHFATEEPGIFALADALQNHLDALQYSVCVSKSRVGAYAFPPREM